MFNRTTSTKFLAETPVKQNSKSEYRNPKQTETRKSEIQNPKRARLEFSAF